MIGAIIGGLKSVFGFVDAIHTSDEERLELKAKLMELQAPIIEATVELSVKEIELRAKLAELELKSDHVIVWSLRPVMTWITFTHWMLVNTGYVPGNADHAFYAFGIIAGLFTGTRGVEKVIRTLKTKEKL